MLSHRKLRYVLVVTYLFLAGCGGGGGDGAAPPPAGAPPPPPVSANPVPVVPPQPPAPGIPTTPQTLYTFSLAKAEAAFVEGTSTKFDLSGTPVAAMGATYLRFVPDNPGHLSVFTPSEQIASQADGSFSVQLSTAATARPGSYSGKINVVACVDVACTQSRSSGPMSIPYVLTIYPRGLDMLAAYDRPLTALAGAGEWTTFQANAGHTGFVPVTLDPTKFAARYRYSPKTASGVELPISEIANSAGTFYFSTGGSCCDAAEYKTYALNEASAVSRWEYKHDNPLAPAAHAPAIVGDKIYVIGGEKGSTTLSAVHAGSGQLSRQSVGGNRTGYFPAPTAYGGVVYTPVDNERSMVTAADVASGFPLFMKGTGVASAGWTPAVDENYFYQYAANLLYVSNRRTGQVEFAIAGPTSAEQQYKSVFAPLLSAPDAVVGIDERNVAVFDTALKKLRWSLAGRFSRGAASDGENLFIINDAGLSMEVRSISDGTLLWRWQSVDFFTDYASEPLVTNNLVFVSTKYATYAIDRKTHATVWTYPASGTLSLSPNGNLFIAGPTKLVAIALH